jgi:hypothetical protein
MPIWRILCYNANLVTWTVVGLTTAQVEAITAGLGSSLVASGRTQQKTPSHNNNFMAGPLTSCRGNVFNGWTCYIPLFLLFPTSYFEKICHNIGYPDHVGHTVYISLWSTLVRNIPWGRLWNDTHQADRYSVKALNLYSGGVWVDVLLGHPLSCLRLSVLFLNASSQILGQCLNYTTFASFQILYSSSVILLYCLDTKRIIRKTTSRDVTE